MRGVIWKLKRFSTQDIQKSSWPQGIKDIADWNAAKQSYNHIIGIWLCIEKGDGESDVEALVKRADELNKQFYNLEKVLVIPFAHLSRNIETPDRAKALLQKTAELFIKKGYRTATVSFGTHKEVKFIVPGQPAQASYFEF